MFMARYLPCLRYLTDPWSDTDKHYPSDSWNDVGTNLYGCLKQLFLLKKKNRNLRVLLSIGGWTYSSNFAAPAATPEGRAKFARSAVDLVKNLGLDGIDIDWEYPKSPTEGQHLVELLRAVRQELDQYASSLQTKHHFELTVASPAGEQNLKNMDLPGMDKYLDFWNLMAYDFPGSWDQKAGHQANLFPSQHNPQSTPFSISKAVEYYLAHGIAAHKIVVGMPLYGRAFENTQGPGHPFQGIGEGSWEAGCWDYKALPLPGFDIHVDEEAGASYCYQPTSKKMVTFDTLAIAQRKASWIRNKGLGGAMWWESSGDKSGDQSIIRTVVQDLGGSRGERMDRETNCLDYPETKYDNLRGGFPGEEAS
jgi:chitinase